MKILVTGAAGLLGTHVVAAAGSRGHKVLALGHAALDVTDRTAVLRAVEAGGPQAVIHCAGYTAVDRAESQPDLARLVNRDGTRNVAEAATGAHATLVYVSTDYVFDGRKRTPYLPTDAPAPLSVYGRTKLEGEEAADRVASGALIVRTSWLYGSGKGFAPAILRRARGGGTLRVVDDQRGRPTWAPHAALALLDLLEGEARGIWHVADGGECTWLELARAALHFGGEVGEVEAISSAERGTPAVRPAYSVLDLRATEERLGRRMPEWPEGLRSEFDEHATQGTEN